MRTFETFGNLPVMVATSGKRPFAALCMNCRLRPDCGPTAAGRSIAKANSVSLSTDLLGLFRDNRPLRMLKGLFGYALHGDSAVRSMCSFLAVLGLRAGTLAK